MWRYYTDTYSLPGCVNEFCKILVNAVIYSVCLLCIVTDAIAIKTQGKVRLATCIDAIDEKAKDDGLSPEEIHELVAVICSQKLSKLV